MKYYNRSFCTSRYDKKGWLNMNEEEKHCSFSILYGERKDSKSELLFHIAVCACEEA
jgi:hypothetical protein